MQETQPPAIDELTKPPKLQEFFLARDAAGLLTVMDARLAQLQSQGHTLIRRVEVSRNMRCPCGSGKKFKRCCMVRAAEPQGVERG